MDTSPSGASGDVALRAFVGSIEAAHGKNFPGAISPVGALIFVPAPSPAFCRATATSGARARAPRVDLGLNPILVIASCQGRVASRTQPEPNMTIREFDSIVIGAGPGGEGAAMKLAKAGLHVAVVEAHNAVGGGCTHWGTIPSKALRHSIQTLADYRRNPLFLHTRNQLEVEFPDLLRAADGVINDQVRTRYRYYQRNRVEVIFGRARFLSPDRIEVQRPGGAAQELTARHFVIATGSRPYHPPDLDFSHPRVLDSDSVLGLKHTPRSMTIYGAGVIGCEYASIMSNLDVKVNLVNTRDRLLSFWTTRSRMPCPITCDKAAS